ncbi:GNAT family N-acetyltransferase [Hymenobacter psychrotolerans]|uniref:Arginine-tRNA-protein transferase n=1 Tax=Hymenobacter psychrotolerans DSM 18569 TaxID=1121959 RepID=A0A1M6Q9V1_9BACT|nr:GNAT family N-acetyltransferase [Hymenobacter psychrotolerans]SHK16910.1 arginine-tRNA-protein transferase [Hymenobacter psychrotolerans DSM 18569]
MSATPSPIRIIPGNALDHYLSQGYYRMAQDLFTCRFLPVEDTLYTVHWLRLVLAEVRYGPEQRRLLRLNERFSVTVRPFQLTEELEELYARYRASITFDAPPTVEAFLLAGATHNVFTTETIEIRDAGQLIAAGIFDSGARTMAGIMNFYDPGYRRHSLGKYLMLLKINLARSRQHQYYYPGYLVHNYPKFDYKLFPCQSATEVFDASTSQWLPFSKEVVATHAAALLDELQREFLATYDSE